MNPQEPSGAEVDRLDKLRDEYDSLLNKAIGDIAALRVECDKLREILKGLRPFFHPIPGCIPEQAKHCVRWIDEALARPHEN